VSDESPEGSVCPLCGVGCRLRPRSDESDGASGPRARGVAGPANPNGRLCRKGVGAFDIADGERLTHPSIRVDGEREAVSWDDAYDRAVEQLTAVREEQGPEAIAVLGAPHCTNEENYLLQKLARALGTNNVDNRSRLCHVTSTRTLATRVGWPATTNGLADLREADLILVAGANPAERQPVAFNSFVRPAVQAGATLVHIDPVGNRTTRLADVHLAPRPDADATVFDLLSARVLDTGGVDRAFVTERTNGVEAFAAGLNDLDEERALAAAGVDAGALDRVARLVTDADRVAAMVGTGVEGGPNAAAALLHLLLLTGNLGRPGTGVHVLRGLANEQGATDAGCAPDRLPGHQAVGDSAARERVAAEWGFEPPAEPGRTATELLAAFGDEVRAALVVGENPAVSKRERDWVRRRLGALETLVVVDVAASETAAHADVLFPAAAGVEKAGTYTNLERRVQRTHPTATPPGEARPDFTILRDLGRRVFPKTGWFDHEDVEDAFNEWTRVAPTHAGVSYPDLGPTGRQWPFDEDGVLYRERFETADGRATFGSVQPVVAPETTGGLRLVTGGRTSEFQADPTEQVLRLHPTDASERGVDPGARVVVGVGETTVAATARVDEDVRRGTVYLPATVADPLTRRGATTVAVDPAEER
jgi:formate dehydrogenase major subunit